jgi:putative aldouronate transport system substrate-binding protein
MKVGKEMKRKLLAWMLVLCMLMLSACGSTAASTAQPSSGESTDVQSVAEAPEPEETDTETPEPEETTEVSAEEAVEEDTFAEGAGVWPISDGSETITIWDGWFPFFSAFFSDYNDTLFFQEMEQRTGIKTEFTLVNAEMAAEQFNLMVATGDYCDLMHDVDGNYVGGLDTAYEEGVIQPIDELIDTWMPNYKAAIDSDEKFRSDLKSDLGNIYQFSILSYDPGYPDYGLIIRQDWLDQLGMDRPETYDEYYDVLTAFKTELGASAPMMLSNCGSYQGNFFASGYGVNGSLVNNSTPMYQVDGVVKYGPIEDGYKQYLETMAKWYSEGLIYKDFFTYTESNTMPPDELVSGDQMGLFGANITDIAERYNSVVGDNSTLRLVGAYDPVEKKGDITHFGTDRSASAGGGYCLSTSCEDPEIVARWADYIYSPEGQILSNYGVEGETFEYDDNGDPVLTDLILHNDTMPTMLALTKYTTFSLVGVQDAYRMYVEFTDEQWEAGEIWALADDAYSIPSGASMTTDESATFNAIYGDISTYVAEITLRVILGEQDISIWDEYVANIENLGIDTCIEQQQAALDRYNAK